MTFIVIAVVFTVLLFILGNIITYKLQHKFIFKPVKLDPSFNFTFKHKFEEIQIRSKNQGLLNTIYFNALKQPKGIVLYFHGNTANLHRWGTEANLFLQYQYNVFMMDFRSFGKSIGPLSEKNYFSDAEACYQYAVEQYPPKQIILYGRSMGASLASYLASRFDIRCVILETPFSSISDLFYSYYPFLPRLFIFKFYFDNQKYLSKVTEPIYIFHGTKDWIVPYRCAKKLKKCIKPGDRFITIEGGNHNNLGEFSIFKDTLQEILEI